MTMSSAAEHLKDEAERAVELLCDLCKPQPPQKPLGDLNPKAIKHCRVCMQPRTDSRREYICNVTLTGPFGDAARLAGPASIS